MKVNAIRTTTPYNINHSNKVTFTKHENVNFVQTADSTTFKRTDTNINKNVFHKINQFFKPATVENDPRYSDSPFIRAFLF